VIHLPLPEERSVALARRYGTILAAAGGALALFQLVGLARRSYWAVAVPVAAVTLAGAGALVWIGRLLMTTPYEPAEF
jgi:phosphoribosylcarboxyaminoimidazole (NCAIR) mutase